MSSGFNGHLSFACLIPFLVVVSSDSRYSDVEIKSNEIVICSVITSSSSDKHEWCTIKRNSDLCSATLQNKRFSTTFFVFWFLCFDLIYYKLLEDAVIRLKTHQTETTQFWNVDHISIIME